MEKLKLMLVDDQSLFTESLCTFLNNYAEDMRVVSKACNGREAVKFCEIEKPDVILMDINMPEMNGIEAVKIIKSKHPEILIIMLSTYDEDAYVREALLSGASGYLLKDLSPTELIMSIRALKSGVLQISPSIVQKMIQAQFVGSSTSDGDAKEADKQKDSDENEAQIKEAAEKKFEWLKTLTKRERQIFALIATGHDNDEIAEELDLALQTVRNQVSTIYSKLGVKDRFEIIKLANKA
ncbi:response regulator transcription factor [Treponema sp. C6A8]|uniref:response regulator transcription factor n=1 Tax=Treponema sp. C6A8 TaxID=1410609 RepID=UPI00047FD143|nr:response regulator transcription factor [Treponema sp. C6A8]